MYSPCFYMTYNLDKNDEKTVLGLVLTSLSVSGFAAITKIARKRSIRL